MSGTENPQDEQSPALHDLQAASVGLPGELVYTAKVGTGMELRLYRDGPGHGRAQWVSAEQGTVLVEEGVRLRLGWEEGRDETDPSHWMAGFVDAGRPDELGVPAYSGGGHAADGGSRRGGETNFPVPDASGCIS